MTAEAEAPASRTTPASRVSRPAAADARRFLIDSLLLMILLVGAAASANRAIGVTDPDLWWHIRTGSWILQHGTLPARDFFSSYAFGKPWIVYHWLFETFASRIFDLWGLRGIVTATMLMTLAFGATLTALLARYIILVRAILLAAVANLALIGFHTPQPFLFTIWFFTIELFLLLQACERNRPAWLLPLIPLFILWANIHIQFVYGLGLIGLFALVGSVTPKWMPHLAPQWSLRPGWLWAFLATSCLSTLVNPYGWRLYTLLVQYATDSVPFAAITELHAPEFRSINEWIALVLICSAWFALGAARRKSPLLLALMAFSCWFGIRAAHDLWFPVIVSALVLAFAMRASEDELLPVQWKCWGLALPLGVILALAVPRFAGEHESALRKVVAENFPDAASAYIRSHALRGPLYNSFNWGGYLIWRLPELPVSVDGRWPVFSHASVDGYDQLSHTFASRIGNANWAEDRELQSANIVLLERNGPLASILRLDSRFRLVYEDKIAVIFTPS